MYYAQLTTGPPSSAPATTAAAMSLFRMGVLVAASSFAVDMAIGWDWAGTVVWQSQCTCSRTRRQLSNGRAVKARARSA